MYVQFTSCVYGAGAFLADRSKVFGCLPHEFLIAKLHAYSSDMESLNLIYDFLSNRKQRVKLGGAYNLWREISYEVQQGSVLWPLLFNIFLYGLF